MEQTPRRLATLTLSIAVLGAVADGPACLSPAFAQTPAQPATGPLRVHPTNPRYFTDGSGKAIYLTGSHPWNNLQDMGATNPPPAFDFAADLDFLNRHGHNFVRLWRFELTTDTDLHRESSALDLKKSMATGFSKR